MKFLEHPKLAQLTALLRALDCGDRVISARAELFSCQPVAPDQMERKLSDSIDELGRAKPQWLTNSPLGPLQSPNTRVLLLNLMSTLNQSFPDYDFSRLTPDNFNRCHDINAVVNSINHNLAVAVERISQGFIGELWSIFRECIDLSDAEVYSIVDHTGSDDGPHSGGLWSFDYFFYDPVNKKLLYFTAVARSKLGDEWKDMDSGMSDSGANSVATGSSRPDELMEGEYEFGDDNWSDADDDI